MKKIDSPQQLGTAPIGALLSIGDVPARELVWFGDEEIQVVVDGLGRPHTFDDSERVLSRWVAMMGTEKDPTCEVMGTWIEDGSLAQGTIAAGTTLMLLTDKYLRCAMSHRGDFVRSEGSMRRLTSSGVFAFIFPLDDIERFIGSKRAVLIGTTVDGILAASVAPASEDWEYSVWMNKAADFGSALMRAVLDAKARHPEEKVRESAARVASTNPEAALTGRRRAEYSFEV